MIIRQCYHATYPLVQQATVSILSSGTEKTPAHQYTGEGGDDDDPYDGDDDDGDDDTDDDDDDDQEYSDDDDGDDSICFW